MITSRTGQAGIVIVNYRSHHLLQVLAERSLAGTDALVVVVDNFSGPAERERVRKLCAARGWEAVLADRNAGFGAGVNAGVARALALGCTTLVVLNPDIDADPGVLDALHRHASAHPDQLISPAMRRADGTPYFRGSQLDLSTGRIRSGWDGSGRDSSGRWQDWLTGACVAFSRDVMDRVGPWDEEFFLYWEDVDWSVRAQQAGIRLVLRDDLEVVHDEGGTQRHPGATRHDDAKSSRYYFYNCRNRLAFAARRLPRRTLLRWIAATPRQSSLILRRGGRRHLLAHPTHLLAGVLGTLSGLAACLRPRRPQPAPSGRPSVLMAHPGAELYGSDRMFLESVSAFRDAGWRVVVVLPDRGPLTAPLEAAGADVRLAPTVVLRKNLLHSARWAATVRTLAAALPRHHRLLVKERPDLLYVNTLTLPVWLLAARLAGVRSLCHVHEAESAVPAPVRWLLYAPTALADRLVLNSRFSLDVCARSSFGVRARSVVVYNGVPGPGRDAADLPARVGELRLAYLGRLSPRKGPQVALQALALLRDRGRAARLDLVGSVFPGYEWFQSELVEQVQRLGLSEHVRFTGFQASVWPQLAEADIVLVPSIAAEPFGNIAVEALMAGRAVVASAGGGLVEATAGYGGVALALPGDAADLAAAVDSLLDRWPDVVESAAADARRATRQYSPAAYREAIVAAATEVLR